MHGEHHGGEAKTLARNIFSAVLLHSEMEATICCMLGSNLNFLDILPRKSHLSSNNFYRPDLHQNACTCCSPYIAVRPDRRVAMDLGPRRSAPHDQRCTPIKPGAKQPQPYSRFSYSIPDDFHLIKPHYLIGPI